MIRPQALPSALAAVGPLLAHRPGRVIVGLAGPPAAGKSTLATALAAALTDGGASAVAVPMDGFHLANAELARLGLADRKGAPETFDATGFVNLLRRLRVDEPTTVYAPTFSRQINESIGSAIPVAPEVRVVVTEGNYLLLDTPPWHEVRPLLDLALYLDAPPLDPALGVGATPVVPRPHQGCRPGLGRRQRRGERQPDRVHPRTGRPDPGPLLNRTACGRWPVGAGVPIGGELPPPGQARLVQMAGDGPTPDPGSPAIVKQ